ncbi:MAG: TadE/TadG family type IV pilus assembly protein [Planctomycetota bacterium]
MSIRHNKRWGRAGQAVVEFALVLPIFLLLILGAVDFGRAYYRLHLLTNAVRVGARAGSLPGSTEEELENIVGSILEDSGLTEEFVLDINVTDIDGNERSGGLSEAEEGDRIQVIIEQDFTIIGIGFIPGTDGTLTLSSSCTFRHE